jgi:hypothetical protein
MLYRTSDKHHALSLLFRSQKARRLLNYLQLPVPEIIEMVQIADRESNAEPRLDLGEPNAEVETSRQNGNELHKPASCRPMEHNGRALPDFGETFLVYTRVF